MFGEVFEAFDRPEAEAPVQGARRVGLIDMQRHAAIVLVGRVVMRPLFRLVASVGMSDLFIATTLFVVPRSIPMILPMACLLP